MGDAEPRRSSRKRTASSRLKDMQSLGISTKQITKRLVDQCNAQRFPFFYDMHQYIVV